MKPDKKLFFFLAGLMLAGTALSAQESNLYVDAQLRTRGELRMETKENTSAFINERARISMGWKNDFLMLHFSGQHTGVWGQTAQNPVNTGDFSVKEAWGQVNFGAQKNFYVKFGRQSLVYDDERILGGLDWHVSGRSHDAFKMGYVSKNRRHQVDVFGSFNQNAIKTVGGTYFAAGGQPYKSMASAWYHFDAKTKNPFGMSLLFMNLGFENGDEKNPSQRFTQTFGTYLTYKPGIVLIEGSLYYQTGKQASGNTISAWMFALKGTANFSKVFSLNAGIDYLSGSDGSGLYKAFDPLYGTHHKFYGLIDYWYVRRSSEFGLIDPYVGIGVNPGKKVNISLAAHEFLTASDAGLKNLRKGGGDNMATEIDLQVTWKPLKYFTVMGGYSGMYADARTAVMNTQNWLWLQLNLNPRIFEK